MLNKLFKYIIFMLNLFMKTNKQYNIFNMLIIIDLMLIKN